MDMKLFLQGAGVLLMLWTAWYSWTTARSAARQKEVDHQSAAITDLTTRVTRLEERIQHLPEDRLVHSLAGDMKAVKSELAALKEALGPLARSLDRINDYLLNQK